MAFQCTVVTPEQQAFDGSITQAILPAHDGFVGILTGRAPLLVQLGVGVLRLDLSDKKAWFVVDGGVAQMKDNKLTIVTEKAISAENVTLETAKTEYADAQGRVPADAQTMAMKKHDMALARAKQDLAAKKG